MKQKTGYQFIVKDYYDNWFEGDIVGTFGTLREAKQCARYYDEVETDGECSLEILKYKDGEFTGNSYGY